MKTLYIECNMGAAGDMLLAALLDLLPEEEAEALLTQLNALGLPGVQIRWQRAETCGIQGRQVSVTIHGQEEEVGQPAPHQHGRKLPEIEEILQGLPLSAWVLKQALAVYRLLAEAEAAAHGLPMPQIHFHEVGELDAIADIVGVCLALERLAPEQILASPVHVGSGQVNCAHGLLPVPAPATARLLEGVPIYGGAIAGELCTPTGAALLQHFVRDFTTLPVLRLAKTGYGIGHKRFAAANCLRAFLGQSPAGGGEVCELSCNLDDMTPEALAFAEQTLLEAGALDVYSSAIRMKKGRQGFLLCCICPAAESERFAALIFRHTSTLGIRENKSRRYTLRREVREIASRFGPVRRKTASGFGVKRSKLEYEDLARIARDQGLSLAEVAALVSQKEGESE